MPGTWVRPQHLGPAGGSGLRTGRHWCLWADSVRRMDLPSLEARLLCERAPGRRTLEHIAVNAHPLVATEKNTLFGRGVCRVMCLGGPG